MNILKTIAGICVPSAETTCRWMLENVERHEQDKINRLLVGAIILFITAIILSVILIVCVNTKK